MPRNLRNRIEQCTPILDENIKLNIISELELYIEDNSNAWLMQEDGEYVQAIVTDENPSIRNAQHELLEKLSEET